MATIHEVIQKLEEWAPANYQESYDNGGLIVGDKSAVVNGVLLALDCTEEIIEEAIQKGCNLVVAHHPIVFIGMKKFTGENYIQRAVIKAIKSDVAIYAIHTALDNVLTGVNAIIGDLLGVPKRQILSPKRHQILQLTIFTPNEYLKSIESALFSAGAGKIGNYDMCSFIQKGEGSFRPVEGANPFEGEKGIRKLNEEIKLEVLVPIHMRSKVQQAMRMAHPYEEIAHNWVLLENANQEIGSGMIGELQEEMNAMDFLAMVKRNLGCQVVKHTQMVKEKVKKVAWCGGSGDFLLEDAIKAGADVYVTSDFKYHRFFDHNNQIMICDVGHYESESCVIPLLNGWFTEKFTTFAIHKTEIVTNPVNYYF